MLGLETGLALNIFEQSTAGRGGQCVNVLRQLVKVLVEVGDEKELKEYAADTLQFKRRRGKKGGQELSKEEQPDRRA